MDSSARPFDGTGRTWPWKLMMPSSVPKEIVDTAIPASWAAWTPSSFGRPAVVSPSDSTTMVAGLGSSSSDCASRAARSVLTRSTDASSASPMAVPGRSCSRSMAVRIAARSSVGATLATAVSAKETRPMRTWSGTSSRNR